MKAKNRKTGEIVDVISFSNSPTRLDSNFVSYIDSMGIEHEAERGNYFWDFEPLPEIPIETKLNFASEVLKELIRGEKEYTTLELIDTTLRLTKGILEGIF